MVELLQVNPEEPFFSCCQKGSSLTHFLPGPTLIQNIAADLQRLHSVRLEFYLAVVMDEN